MRPCHVLREEPWAIQPSSSRSISKHHWNKNTLGRQYILEFLEIPNTNRQQIYQINLHVCTFHWTVLRIFYRPRLCLACTASDATKFVPFNLFQGFLITKKTRTQITDCGYWLWLLESTKRSRHGCFAFSPLKYCSSRWNQHILYLKHMIFPLWPRTTHLTFFTSYLRRVRPKHTIGGVYLWAALSTWRKSWNVLFLWARLL